MTAKLVYENDLLAIKDFVHYEEDAKNNNPYNTAFNLEVRSGLFSGIASCEYDIKKFHRFISELNELYEFKRKSVLFNDLCYGTKVQFLIDKTGHLEISGEIFGEAAIQSLKFLFVADQTALRQFVRQIKMLVDSQ